MPPRRAERPHTSPILAEEATARLRDGTEVRLRPVRPDDRARITAFVRGLSPESLELRYFSAVSAESAVDRIVGSAADPRRRSMLLELTGTDPATIVAHGEFDPVAAEPGRGEVAFLVADAWHGHGAATVVLLHLARLAAADGVRQLEAVVRAENQPMIDVFLGAGFPCAIVWRDGEGRVVLDIGAPPGPTGIPRGAAGDPTSSPA
ncbi:MAG TPA: GNAT family N-acetyltransferase [Thermoplasmata archaeon]|nr:GNAT family N-acetyltransferase [Thermoplasmata archaeon]